MLRIEAIKKFLKSQPFDMGYKYNENMEIQINVAQDNGKLIKGSYAGRSWYGYTDRLQTWKSFRIPWEASSNPHYEDRDIQFDISIHAEAIGMTGWDWKNKSSKWVGFDFDSIIGHKQGLTQDEIQTIQKKLYQLKFVTLYTSTSGLGLHVYIFLNVNCVISTHTHHSAVARAILNKISALTGLELKAKVDTLGGNMWIWHRRALSVSVDTDNEIIPYHCLKQGSELTDIPLNWEDYLEHISHKGKITSTTDKDNLVAAKNKLTLNKDHIKLLEWFENSSALHWWDDPKQMLVCHTYDLKTAHQELLFKGYFNTISTGKDQGHDQNCFCFPLSDGAWIVRRHTKRIIEHSSWFYDDLGWTTSYYNRLPTFRTASKLMGGIEGEKAYYFKNLKQATKVLLAMEIECNIPLGCEERPTSLIELKDGRIKITFERNEYDSIEDWAQSKNKKDWERIFFYPKIMDETNLPDDIIKHVTIGSLEYGWFVYTNNSWIQEPKINIISALISRGYKHTEIEILLGQSILYNWKLINKPFQLEYPGNREWNKEATQLRFNPQIGKHPSWDLIFDHAGENLNDILLENDWSKINGILTGLLYLTAWCASFIQQPNEPLPYLFFYGSQNTGKSIFHEALSILFTKGCCRADQALTNPNGFNGELASAILCIIEETNLSKRGYASDRIKDWVTGRTLSIHSKKNTPYDIINCTHWVQCANDSDYCPTFPGDTRITMIKVDKLKQEIPKPILLERCEKEASAFLGTLLNFELPVQEGRLRIPIIDTLEKLEQMEYNQSALDRFISDSIFKCDGEVLKFSEFYDKFQQWLEPIERIEWTKRKVSKTLNFPKGKWGNSGQLYIGNISMSPLSGVTQKIKFKVSKGRLI